MDKSWLRQNGVDILKYLPQFLSTDKEFKSTADSCSTEHEQIRLLLSDIFNQFFIETATWGLNEWENTLAIVSSSNDTLEQRRNRILLKLQSSQTSTLAYMIDLVKRYVTKNADLTIEEDNKNNMFHIICRNGNVLYSDDLIVALETYKPAHLAYRIALVKLLELNDEDKINYGLVNVSIGKKHIKTTKPEQSKFNGYIGCAEIRIGKKLLQANKPAFFINKKQVAIMKIKTGKITIGGIK